MTITAPSNKESLATGRSVTPCPVDWCPSAGGHQWDAVLSEPMRWHTLSVQDFISDDGSSTSEVAVDCYETVDGVRQTIVELFNGHSQLINRDEVNELVASIQRAADIAFGPAEGLNNPETPAAERAVLFAVQELTAGRAGLNAVIDAWERLQIARTLPSARQRVFTDDREKADTDEFDAATAELVERAGNPTDVNRLVAAAIRFRNAYLGA